MTAIQKPQATAVAVTLIQHGFGSFIQATRKLLESELGTRIREAYIASLRKIEETNNKKHEEQLTEAERDFQLRKRPLIKGSLYEQQYVRMKSELMAKLLHKENKELYGKAYYGHFSLKDKNDLFTKDRWLRVLISQHPKKLTKEEKTEQRKQILHCLDIELFRAWLKREENPDSPFATFAERAINYIKKNKGFDQDLALVTAIEHLSPFNSNCVDKIQNLIKVSLPEKKKEDTFFEEKRNEFIPDIVRCLKVQEPWVSIPLLTQSDSESLDLQSKVFITHALEILKVLQPCISRVKDSAESDISCVVKVFEEFKKIRMETY